MSLASYLPKPSLDARLMGAHRLSLLTDDALFDSCGVRVAFSGRRGGASPEPYASLNLGTHVGDDPVCVSENRRRVLEALGAPDAPLVVPNQVHKTDLVSIDGASVCRCACMPADASQDDQENETWTTEDVDVSLIDSVGAAKTANELAAQGADALVIRSVGVAGLLNFADCTPVIIVSPSGNFAIAHAGWRGAVAGVASKTATNLIEADLSDEALKIAHPDFASASFQDVLAGCNVYIGPHIQVECFETGADVADRFREAFPQARDVVVPDDRHVDLSQAVIADLVSIGVDPARICDCGICTKCNHDEYFSYRAENGTCGRHGAVAIRLKG